jgi:hypothetical protein
MKTIKPGAVALLTRTIEFRGRFRFIVTPMLFVSLQGPLRLRGEAALWQFAAEELGPEAALDACMPKVRGEYIVQARARPPAGPAAACAVRARVASSEKILVAHGERQWLGQEPQPGQALCRPAHRMAPCLRRRWLRPQPGWHRTCPPPGPGSAVAAAAG